ncbi:MAG TPA: hypothetical protein VGS80_15870, partial [Ktedonobacterales bacterium]|nr:hypothetical protein [Ktedonobacterales bacterium]
AKGIEPYIETDCAALLVNLLVASGIAMGRGPYVQVGAKRHYAVLNAVTVGGTADNKSDAKTPIMEMTNQAWSASIEAGMEVAYGELAPPMLPGGLSTGEGLLWQIRDERREKRHNKKTGTVDEVVADEGVADKRLLVVEAEFARVLAVMYRDGNTLSTVLRDLFDCPPEAKSCPKNNPVKATAPHVGLIGQVTPEELERKMHDVELFNGFANRFLWPMTHRVKSLPSPPDYTPMARTHAEWWVQAVYKARARGAIHRDHHAEQQWQIVYDQLRDGERPGLPPRQGFAREVCARAQVMVLRIAR